MTDAQDFNPNEFAQERVVVEPPQYWPLWRLLSGWLTALEAWLRSHGGRKLRTTIRVFWAVVAGFGAILLAGPVIDAPLTLDDITSSASTVTESWIARDFDVHYEFSLNEDGALVVDVEERIAAYFPEGVDENAIERVLPTQYQGHSLNPSSISAILDGVPIDVERFDEVAQTTLSLDAGERLSGDHDVVLNYTLHDIAYDTTDRSTGATVQLIEWDALGASWQQGLSQLTVTVDVSDELNDGLVRLPRGVVAWSLLSSGAWLEPEASGTSGYTRYDFSNEQNLPPYASAVFSITVEPDTITMPERSPYFWVQTFGPLAPLALLLLTLLLAIAARKVAWSDDRGRPWYVAQFEPPHDVTPTRAAHILRAPRALELANALQALIQTKKRKELDRHLLLKAGRVARRAGRVGDRPRALARYGQGSEGARQIAEKLRRVPDGFVRDTFIGAPIALTIVQWGLVRQLSHHAPITIVWWPAAFVLLSTALAVIVLALALSARPLTKKGALLKQHLLGIQVYAERTDLLQRGTFRDPVLPYAVLSAPARQAGAIIFRRVELELGRSITPRSWLTSDYLTRTRLAVRAIAAALIVGAIATATITPNPYESAEIPVSYSGGLPGTLFTQVTGLSAIAELTRSDDGHAVIEASEVLDVVFNERSVLPSQVVREWPRMIDGQDLQVSVQQVQLDGEPVSFATKIDGDNLAVYTTVAEPLVGDHTVNIEYTIAAAAVAAQPVSGGPIIDRVRWGALIRGWSGEYGDDDRDIDPLRFELRVSEELADEALRGGWITLGSLDSIRNFERIPDGVIPFGVAGLDDPESVDESTTTASGIVVHSLALTRTAQGFYAGSLVIRDVGTILDFPAGTFVGPSSPALRVSQFMVLWPPVLTSVMGGLGLLLGVCGMGLVARRGRKVLQPGLLRDIVKLIVPALGVSTIVLTFWASFSISATHPVVPWMLFAGLAGLAGAAIAGVLLRLSYPVTDAEDQSARREK